MERVKGIEPSYEAWEAAVLPLNYTRILSSRCHAISPCQRREASREYTAMFFDDRIGMNGQRNIRLQTFQQSAGRVAAMVSIVGARRSRSLTLTS